MASVGVCKKLLDYVSGFYGEAEWPALARQCARWCKDRPLDGLEILDATPIFRNTLPKYAALAAAGARVSVSSCPTIPGDMRVVGMLAEFGIGVASPERLEEGFDAVLDCGAAYRDVPSRLGYCELTRTGAAGYAGCQKPVFLADSSLIKAIETGLGTGDGFVRAMEALGHPPDRASGPAVVFGCGKVGCGIVMGLLARGVEVFAVDDLSRARIPAGAVPVDMRDRPAVESALEGAWCAVSATGVRGALRGMFDSARLAASETILANMGVEDEYGREMPSSRVLNGKRPLNFILEEPTHLKYIDPTLALHNFGAVKLLEGALPPGISVPSAGDQEPILSCVRRAGVISKELERLEAWLGAGV